MDDGCVYLSVFMCMLFLSDGVDVFFCCVADSLVQT